jgi:signal transduction histidine kinase
MTPSGAKAVEDALQEAKKILSGVERDRVAGVIREIDRALSGFDESESPTGTRRRTGPSLDAALPAELLDVACHDLKDPLAAIVMGSAFLAKSLPEDDGSARARRLVGAIQRSAERLNRIVQNLLDFAKLERGRIVPAKGEHELGALVEEAAQRLAESASERKVRVVSDVTEPGRRIFCDAERIVQAIVQLGSNALRYSPEGDVVTLRARVDDGNVAVSVIDHGPGISGERRVHIFDRYYHMRRSPRDGTGLGIAIARGLVEAHGGSISLESDDKGSTFTLSFRDR